MVYAAPASAQEDDAAAAAPAAADAAEEGDALPAEMPQEAAAVVEVLKSRFAGLAELLARVQDAESAAALLPAVQAQFVSLLQSDAAALEAADEEELAAEFAEAFAPIDAELARLEEADFFGSEALRAVFAESEEAAETDSEDAYVFPLGPLDFLRGAKAERRYVCPRNEGGLHLMDWSDEE